MSDKVSIIIPVYKTEKFLNRAVESALNQSHQSLELILVDDGSPDKCPQLCDEWAKKDERIKVIHKKNAGLGMARNSGIELASGDYITFLDSDDYLHPDTCKTALRAIKKNNADICCYSSTDVYGDKQIPVNISDFEGVYSEKKLINSFLANSIAPDEYHTNNTNIPVSACMLVYKAELFKNKALRFVSERQYLNEDLIFRIELCKHIKTAVVIPQPFYYYYHNDGTLTTRYLPDRFQKSITMFKKVNEDVAQFNLPKLYKHSKMSFMINLIVSLKQEVLFEKQNGFFNALKNIKRICKNETTKEVLSSYPINKLPFEKKLLFNCVKRRLTILIWILFKANNKRKRKSTGNIYGNQTKKSN